MLLVWNSRKEILYGDESAYKVDQTNPMPLQSATSMAPSAIAIEYEWFIYSFIYSKRTFWTHSIGPQKLAFSISVCIHVFQRLWTTNYMTSENCFPAMVHHWHILDAPWTQPPFLSHSSKFNSLLFALQLTTKPVPSRLSILSYRCCHAN